MIISETEGFFSMHTSKFFLYRFVHYMWFLEDEFKLVVVHKFKESTFYRLFPYYLKTERRLESLGITMSAIATLMLPGLSFFTFPSSSFVQPRSSKSLFLSFFSISLISFSAFFIFFPIFIHPLIYFSSWSYFILFFYISFTSFFLFSLSFSFSHSSPSSFVFFLLYFFFRQCLFIKAYMKFTQ